MKIEFISAESVFTAEVAWIELYTKAGLIAVYEGHAPLIAPLLEQKDITLYSQNGSQRKFTVEQAIAHINRTSVTIIASDVHEKTNRPNSGRVSF